MPTWDSEQYLRYSDERTRPCRELAARIAVAAPSRVIDLGCGPGNSTAVLRERWPDAELTGLDSSSEMIAAARRDGPRASWRKGDIAAWSHENGEVYDVVFSNAALHWVDDHARAFPRLLGHVAQGGALAIQMPGNYDSPAHRIMRELAASSAWQARFPAGGVREWHVHDLPAYYDILAPFAANLDIWQTEYFHIMADASEIAEWYKGTGLRPFLDALDSTEQRADFLAQYRELIRREYPPRQGGRVIFPFRRLFLVAYQRAYERTG